MTLSSGIRRSLIRRSLVSACAALLAGTGLLAGAGTAVAHNALVGSDPANGAQLPSGPGEVRLDFGQPVRQDFHTVTVIGPNGGQWAAGDSTVRGDSVSAPVRELGPAGEYTVGYRIMSDDGHPVSGRVTFTLTRPGQGTPAPPVPDRSGTDQPPAHQHGDHGGGTPVWPWIAGAVVLVAAGVVVSLRLGRGPRE